MKIQFYGLLHTDENQQSAMNVSVKDFQDQVSVYVKNAITLAKTLQSQGFTFTLFTNNKTFVEDCVSLAGNSFPLSVKEIPFTTKVPSGCKFYSAHFKLDVFRYFASLSNGYHALCDLDMICINNYPLCLKNIVEAGIPLYYDISDQVIPAYGMDVIIRDLKAVNGLESEGRWSGGEFISGTPEFFMLLVKGIDNIYGNYISNLATLHHVGDEAITSSALEILRRQGVYIADAGTLGIIGRYWNTDVLHPQRPFDYFRQSFLLHLPADKRFLSDLAQRNTLTPSDFQILYAKYRVSFVKNFKKRIRQVLQLLRNFIYKE